VRGALKRVRDFPPLNAAVTSAVKAVVRRPGAWLVRYLPRTGVIETPLPNGRQLKLWSLADDWVASPVFWRGWDGYERETARVFYAQVQKARVVLDVGAHVGYFTVLGALANPRARVVAFEPNPTVFARLARNIQVNALTNVEPIRKAVGRQSGSAEFYFVPEGIPANSSLSLDYIRTCEVVESSTVDVVAIDDFLAERGIERVDLVKIDTETTEADVLAGMARTLARCRPTILCEILSPGAEQRIRDLLDPLAYHARVIAADGRNYLFEPR
jgi:FkbM family methyltransferase